MEKQKMVIWWTLVQGDCIHFLLLFNKFNSLKSPCLLSLQFCRSEGQESLTEFPAWGVTGCSQFVTGSCLSRQEEPASRLYSVGRIQILSVRRLKFLIPAGSSSATLSFSKSHPHFLMLWPSPFSSQQWCIEPHSWNLTSFHYKPNKLLLKGVYQFYHNNFPFFNLKSTDYNS